MTTNSHFLLLTIHYNSPSYLTPCSVSRKTSASILPSNRWHPIHFHDRTSREGYQAWQQLSSFCPNGLTMLDLKLLGPGAKLSSPIFWTFCYSRSILARSGWEPPSSQYPRLANHVILGHLTAQSPSSASASKSSGAYFYKRFRTVCVLRTFNTKSAR